LRTDLTVQGKGARGGGGTPPELCSAAGEVAGVAKPAFQGAIKDRVWPWSIVVACVIHWSG